ncbi:hypothetical protein Tco_0404492 [Tanacetum coccineum]
MFKEERRKGLKNLCKEDIFSAGEWSSYLWPGNPQVDVVFDGAFKGVGDKKVVVGEGVVVISSSLDMLTNNCLEGIMIPKGVCQNAEIRVVPRWDSGQLYRNSEVHSRRIRDL